MRPKLFRELGRIRVLDIDTVRDKTADKPGNRPRSTPESDTVRIEDHTCSHHGSVQYAGMSLACFDSRMRQSLRHKLPAEVLGKIFAQILYQDQADCGTGRQGAHESIKNMRLASKQFAEISCRYLMRSVAISLTSQSFSRLEEVCRHAIFSKSVKRVAIDVSFYDVQLAHDRRKFLSDCSARFNYALEMRDFSDGCALVHGRYTEAHKSRSKEAYAIGRQLEELANSNAVTTVFTEPQQRFMDQYNIYVERTNDQELLRADNNHIKRLCACLSQLPALEEIQLLRSSVHEAGSQCEDLEQYILEGGESVKETPSAVYSLALDKQCWNGTSGTADSLEPPIEMMGELLSQLGRANIRPLRIKLELDVPADLTRVQPNQTQCDGIQQLLSRCSTIDIDFHGWEPEDKWGDHGRTRQEMVALGSMMKALTSTPALRMLRVYISRATQSANNFQQSICPTYCQSDLFHGQASRLSNSITSPSISTIFALSWIPLNIHSSPSKLMAST